MPCYCVHLISASVSADQYLWIYILCIIISRKDHPTVACLLVKKEWRNQWLKKIVIHWTNPLIGITARGRFFWYRWLHEANSLMYGCRLWLSFNTFFFLLMPTSVINIRWVPGVSAPSSPLCPPLKESTGQFKNWENGVIYSHYAHVISLSELAEEDVGFRSISSPSANLRN